MTMTYVEKQELKVEVCKGFELMLDTVERIKKLANELESGATGENKATLLAKMYFLGLAGVQNKLNKLLEEAYALNDPEYIKELKEATGEVSKGKEDLLYLAMMLGEEL